MGLFDKVKDLANETLEKTKDLASETLKQGQNQMSKEAIQEKISQGITKAVDQVIKEKEEEYSNNPSPDKASIQTTIDSYANKNAMISGGAGLIPGPWGMAAAIPEITLIMKNQMSMIYDIAKAHGQTKVSPEILIAVLFGAVGQGATSLLVVQGQKVMAKRIGAQALQKIIKALGGNITQKLAKSMAAKWLPVAGAVAMAAWSKYSTHKIATQAVEVFSKDIVYDDSETLDLQEEDLQIQDNTEAFQSKISKLKIGTLINLMKIDGTIDDTEVTFIEGFIEKSNLSNEEQMSLIEEIGSSSKIQIDYSIFKNNTDEGLYLLIDLIALAKVDGEFHVTEKMFIKGISKVLNFDVEDLKELME